LLPLDTKRWVVRHQAAVETKVLPSSVLSERAGQDIAGFFDVVSQDWLIRFVGDSRAAGRAERSSNE
jgi:hypothetical protein